MTPKTPALLPTAGLRPTGLTLPTNLSREDWEEVGFGLSTIEEALPWALGDWLLARPKGVRDDDAVMITGKEWETLRVYRWVAEKVDPVTRVTDLTWRHHRAVAALEPWEQARMLERADLENMTVRTLEAEVKAVRAPVAQEAELPSAGNSPDHAPSELVDPTDAFDALEEEYGITRTSAATPKNAVRAGVRDSLKALSSLLAAIDGVTTWPPDLAAEFNPVWEIFIALGDRFTTSQEVSV